MGVPGLSITQTGQSCSSAVVKRLLHGLSLHPGASDHELQRDLRENGGVRVAAQPAGLDLQSLERLFHLAQHQSDSAAAAYGQAGQDHLERSGTLGDMARRERIVQGNRVLAGRRRELQPPLMHSVDDKLSGHTDIAPFLLQCPRDT